MTNLRATPIGRLLTFVLGLSMSGIGIGVAYSATPTAAICGDTAGKDGKRIACACGDTVITDTLLRTGDPVVKRLCSAGAITIAAGVALDLNGQTITGSGGGTGIELPGNGMVRNGTVRSFGMGIRVTTNACDASNVTVTDMAIEENLGDGAWVDVSGDQSRVVFERLAIQRNGGNGIRVRGAPGASNLDDVTHDMELNDYGFVLESSAIHDNGGAGIHLGDAAQTVDVAARIGGPAASSEISRNLGVGILLEQNAGLAQGADCGDSAGQPGCTGATIVNNRIHDNAGSGVELRSGFIIPLFIPGTIELGLGFVQNFVSHNAMAGPGCNVSQSAPQIFVKGPVGLSNAYCSGFNGDPEACEEETDPGAHCVAVGSQCVVSWDLRGDVAEQCPSGLRNAIFGYNTGNTIPGDDDGLTVGIRAINNSHVNASHNEWQHTTSSQNITQGAGSFVLGELTCGTRSCGN